MDCGAGSLAGGTEGAGFYGLIGVGLELSVWDALAFFDFDLCAADLDASNGGARGSWAGGKGG